MRRPAPVASDAAPSIGAAKAGSSVLERLRIGARRGAPAMAADRPDPLVAQLLSTGLDRDLATRVARAVPRGPRRIASAAAIEAALATELGGLVAGDEPFAPVELFVGPPGVGKTTTIAKIAAQERARRGRRLSLLAADGFRVGAVEQLRLYADLIGSPFAVARTPAEIERSLVATASPLLVDTAGRSLGDARALRSGGAAVVAARRAHPRRAAGGLVGPAGGAAPRRLRRARPARGPDASSTRPIRWRRS